MPSCSQENNFKAVLESIRDLLNEDTIIPDWLTNIFLGYGDPAGAQYQSIAEDSPESFIRTIDFKDTFLDVQHLKDSFPGRVSPPSLGFRYRLGCLLGCPLRCPLGCRLGFQHRHLSQTESGKRKRPSQRGGNEMK